MLIVLKRLLCCGLAPGQCNTLHYNYFLKLRNCFNINTCHEMPSNCILIRSRTILWGKYLLQNTSWRIFFLFFFFFSWANLFFFSLCCCIVCSLPFFFFTVQSAVIIFTLLLSWSVILLPAEKAAHKRAYRNTVHVRWGRNIDKCIRQWERN